MVHSCSAFNCSNEYMPNRDIKFHRFPLKNNELLNKWVVAVRRENFQPNSSSRLCSQHFCESDYKLSTVGERKLLKQDAVPSVFNFTNPPQRNISCQKVLVRTNENTDIDQHEKESISIKLEILEHHPSSSCQFIDVSTQVESTDLAYSPNEKQLSCKIKKLKQKLQRRDKKIQHMQDLISSLKKKGYMNENLDDTLSNN